MFILFESNLSRTHGLHVYEERPNWRLYVSCPWIEFEDTVVLDSELETNMEIK
jgi:hypothetical protein